MSEPFDTQDLPAHILIVDDERQNRRLLEVMLTDKNYRLQTAEGGEEALALLAKQLPDLILLDVMTRRTATTPSSPTIRHRP